MEKPHLVSFLLNYFVQLKDFNSFRGYNIGCKAHSLDQILPIRLDCCHLLSFGIQKFSLQLYKVPLFVNHLPSISSCKLTHSLLSLSHSFNTLPNANSSNSHMLFSFPSSYLRTKVSKNFFSSYCKSQFFCFSIGQEGLWSHKLLVIFLHCLLSAL